MKRKKNPMFYSKNTRKKLTFIAWNMRYAGGQLGTPHCGAFNTGTSLLCLFPVLQPPSIYLS
jgi:hypothetical protein